MFANHRTGSTFEEIPIMLVILSTQLPTHHPISISRDLKDATNPDPEIRKALATRIRDSCINVGFFYGSASPFTTPPSRLIISSEQSRNSRACDRTGSRCREEILCIALVDKR